MQTVRCKGYPRGTIGYEDGYTLQKDINVNLTRLSDKKIIEVKIVSDTEAWIFYEEAPLRLHQLEALATAARDLVARWPEGTCTGVIACNDDCVWCRFASCLAALDNPSEPKP